MSYYDSGEYIDPISGEVTGVELDENYIRAFTYDDYERKRHHEAFMDPRHRKIFASVWKVGKSLDIPERLIREAFYFMLKMRELKISSVDGLKIPARGNDKFIKAVYLVLAEVHGLDHIQRKIRYMACNENGDPCYASRKRGDPEFRKYLRAVSYAARKIYPNSDHRNPYILIERLRPKCPFVSDAVFARAKDYVPVLMQGVSGKKVQTVVGTALALACKELSPELLGDLIDIVCSCLGVSESAIRLFMKSFEQEARG